MAASWNAASSTGKTGEYPEQDIHLAAQQHACGRCGEWEQNTGDVSLFLLRSFADPVGSDYWAIVYISTSCVRSVWGMYTTAGPCRKQGHSCLLPDGIPRNWVELCVFFTGNEREKLMICKLGKNEHKKMRQKNLEFGFLMFVYSIWWTVSACARIWNPWEIASHGKIILQDRIMPVFILFTLTKINELDLIGFEIYWLFQVMF